MSTWIFALAIIGAWFLFACAMGAGMIAVQRIRRRIRMWRPRCRLFHVIRIRPRCPTAEELIRMGTWEADNVEIVNLGDGIMLALGRSETGEVLEARYVDAKHKEAA